MKLYYSKGACSLVVRIVINEIGLQCEFESVDLKSKKTEKGNDFLSINPKGSVPTLELSDKNILTENCVIQQYLADSNKATALLPAINNFERYRVLEWLNFITTDIHKTFSPLFNPSVPSEVKKDIFIPILQKKFGFVAKNLGTKKYIFGDTFTLPDAYLFVMLMWAKSMKVDISEFEVLGSYFEQLKQRPSIQKSLQEEGINL